MSLGRARLVLLIVVSLFCLGCSARYSFSSLSSKLFDSGDGDLTYSGDESEELRAPLAVEVNQAFVDEAGVLHVNVKVTAQTTLDARKVAVALVGLSDGTPIERELKNLSQELSADRIYAGKSAILLFSMKAAGLSEYQVQCAWGDDSARLALPVAGEKAKAVSGDVDVKANADSQETIKRGSGDGRVILENVEVESTALDCDVKPCNMRYAVTASIRNATLGVVNDVLLATGFVWVAEGESLTEGWNGHAKNAAQEQVVRLEGLNLQPGASRAVRVNIDRVVPLLSGGSFVPRVRLVD